MCIRDRIFDAEEPPYFCTPSMGSIRFYEDQLDQRGVQFALIFDLVGHDVTFPTEYLPILSEMLGPIGSQAAQDMIKNFLFLMGSESHIELPTIAARASESNAITMLATLNESQSKPLIQPSPPIGFFKTLSLVHPWSCQTRD